MSAQQCKIIFGFPLIYWERVSIECDCWDSILDKYNKKGVDSNPYLTVLQMN